MGENTTAWQQLRQAGAKTYVIVPGMNPTGGYERGLDYVDSVDEYVSGKDVPLEGYRGPGVTLWVHLKLRLRSIQRYTGLFARPISSGPPYGGRFNTARVSSLCSGLFLLQFRIPIHQQGERLRGGRLLKTIDQEAFSVGSYVIVPLWRNRCTDPKQGPSFSEDRTVMILGELHGHESQIRGCVKEFPTIATPNGRTTSVCRDLPLAGTTGKRSKIELIFTGLIRAIRDPLSIGRNSWECVP